MRQRHHFFGLPIAVVAATIVAALQLAAWSAKGSPKTAQAATIVIDGGYTPATVTVKAGQPVKLTFVRKEKAGCGDVVQFPTLGLKRTLKTGEKAVVSFTPKKAGAIPFTCGMNMYQGEVVAR